MNILTAQYFIRRVGRWSALLAAIFLVAGAKADVPEPGRCLLVFETSPALKKNLPVVRQALDGLFASNLQHELQMNDDLAVWTADSDLHTGTFPLASWAPEDAEMYSSRLKDFLGHQNFTRRATLSALQPLLNRVVKNSERLTVLVFCDSDSRLLGTPYDSGVNDIIKKASAAGKGVPQPFILVLRSYHGEYLGCSVNRSVPLSFPKFPPPPAPKPEPPPVSKSPPVTAPAVVPVPALIIVGTNVGTNLSALTKPAPPPSVQPTAQPATNIAAANLPASPPRIVATPVVVAPPANPTPVAIPPPAPVTSAPAPVFVPPVIVAATNPPGLTNVTAVITPMTDTGAAADTGFQKLVILGSGLLAVALGLVIWLVKRSRRPRGSLITSSMQDDPRLPPRK